MCGVWVLECALWLHVFAIGRKEHLATLETFGQLWPLPSPSHPLQPSLLLEPLCMLLLWLTEVVVMAIALGFDVIDANIHVIIVVVIVVSFRCRWNHCHW